MSRGDLYFSFTCDRCARGTESLLVVRREGKVYELICKGCAA